MWTFALFPNVLYSILAGKWYITGSSVKLSFICPFPAGASKASPPGEELKYDPTAQSALPLTLTTEPAAFVHKEQPLSCDNIYCTHYLITKGLVF